MKITLGYCGPTDSCLVLSNGQLEKEYLIESLAWRVLGLFWNYQTASNPPLEPEEVELLQWVWDNRNEDLRSVFTCQNQ